MLGGLEDGKHATPPGRLRTPQGATNTERFTRDHTRHGIAFVHAVGVHNPGHHLGVGVHSRGWNIAGWANEKSDFRGIAAREPFDFMP